jgi:hypothetical protein
MRLIFALTFGCVLASTAWTKDLCIQIDSGTYSGSELILKKVNLGAGKVGPIYGYLARWDVGALEYYSHYPVSGHAMSSTRHQLAIGLSLHTAAIAPQGGYSVNAGDDTSINLICVPGADGVVNVLDGCACYFDGAYVSAHVVDCDAVPPIP